MSNGYDTDTSDSYESRIEDLQEEMGQLQAENAKLKGALNKYGHHKNDCAYVQGLKGHSIELCDCGFEQALKEE